jgi:hypothetical protein
MCLFDAAFEVLTDGLSAILLAILLKMPRKIHGFEAANQCQVQKPTGLGTAR